ncbi:MAG TPA: prenyltransferase/squalene oxidase repeat-containing protein [Planctomycetota bacterium]|nr:prenyltransferase/squalene oxidase repeat-containing protein [Planctomycetota bacterium]
MLPRFLLPTLLLATPALSLQEEQPPTPAATSQEEAQQPGWTASSLKLRLDAAARWLRDQQEPNSGYYGDKNRGQVETTAWVLRALAECPRHYQHQDGPFISLAIDFLTRHQSSDGSIRDWGTSGAAIRAQTMHAVIALEHFGDEALVKHLERAHAYLGDWDPGVLLGPIYADTEQTRARVTKLLAAGGEDGSWNGPRGPVIETARAMIELSRIYEVVRPRATTTAAARALPAFGEADRMETLGSMTRGALFLIMAGEGSKKGQWGAPDKPDAGISAMVLAALQSLPAPRPAGVQGAIDAGLDWLVSLQNEDGSIHDGKLANYITSASVMALAASREDRHRAALPAARDFLVRLQADEGEGYSEGDLYYGGIGYGGDEKPDLSNLQMALEALAASGLEQDHEAFKRAVKFLERCQNRSESNDTERSVDGQVIVPGNDGGSAYAPGDSPAGFTTLSDGRKVPRSYGSMTYALLKGFIFAGLPRDDPRMQAAWEWVREHYTLDVNPGFEEAPDPAAAYQGLFYYFHTMARALDLYGVETITDKTGQPHAWRRELAGRLVAMQSPEDGSWVNHNAPRWWEGNPVLATSYALLTLGAALPPQSK